MCEFCIEHGQGTKWYLQTKNYAEELLNEERKRYITDFYERFEEGAATGLAALDKLVPADLAVPKVGRSPIAEGAKQQHFGQVIPLEDVEKILDFTTSITRVHCACRSVLHGVYDDRYCFNVATFKSDFWPKGVWEQWPDYSKGIEILTVEEAKKEFQKLDRNGLVHSVWHYNAPFIAAICNCAPTDCLGFRMMERGQRPFFKAEYVAAIDIEQCNGCRDCVKICPFGAIAYSPASQKCTIHQLQCFGCGLCRGVCALDAITLLDRNAIPVLAKEW